MHKRLLVYPANHASFDVPVLPAAGAMNPRVLAIPVAVALTLPCQAAPPPGTDLDGPMHAWFERQHSVAGAWCCDLSDGYLLDADDWRAVGSRYEVRINGAWLPVPPDAIRDPVGGPNPTGKAIVWRSHGDPPHIYCFSPGIEF